MKVTRTVYVGEPLPDTVWISEAPQPNDMVMTCQHSEPMYRGEPINTGFSIPISSAFEKFPRKITKVTVIVEGED